MTLTTSSDSQTSAANRHSMVACHLAGTTRLTRLQFAIPPLDRDYTRGHCRSSVWGSNSMTLGIMRFQDNKLEKAASKLRA